MKPVVTARKKPLRLRLKKDMLTFGGAYLMGIPVLAYYILFHYKPLFGAVIAFKDYKPRKGILASPWVGFKHFESFFNSFYFGRLIGNTLTISISSLLFTFPIAIIFALLVNEIRSNRFKRAVQTISYMPHFISTIVVCSMVMLFVDSRGFTAVMVSWMSKFNPFIMIAASLLLVTMDRGASEVSSSLGLNHSFADILTGFILFFIIATEFFITYKVTLRKSSKKEA